MSDLFNLSNILNEVSESIIQTHSDYDELLPICINKLKEIDTSVFESTTDLHVALLEADSKKKENDKFADFFREYKNTIQSYITQARSLVSTFTINLETFADANNDLDCSIDDIPIGLTYKGIDFTNLSKDNSPNIQPYDVFKKEFCFIGKLMQDLGPMASEDQKTKIIATVCNNLSKEIQDGWLNKAAKKISGNDNVDKDGFARSMYNYFVREHNKEMEIDIGLLKQSQLDITNYMAFVDNITKSVDSFCCGLEKIRDEVGSLFFRNKDHKLPIKTNVDGIEDRVYRLNDYSFNQLNIFISTKISQITELANLYLVALSIKMDCVYKYLKQCKDIINIVNDTPSGDYCGSDNDFEFDDNFDDYDGGDDTDFSDFDDDGKDVVQDDSEIEMECYLFGASIYEQTRVIKSLTYRQSAYESLLEDSTAGSTNTQDTTSDNKAGFFKSKLNSIKAVIDNIIRRIKILIEKFKSSVTGNYGKRIAYIRTNIDAINNAVIPTDWTIQRMNVTKLLGMKIQPINTSEFDTLQNIEDYVKKHYPGILADPTKEGQSVKKRMMGLCMPDEKEMKYENSDRQTGITFVCNQFEDKALKGIDESNKTIEKSRQAVEKLMNPTNESVLSNYDDMMNIDEYTVTSAPELNRSNNGGGRSVQPGNPPKPATNANQNQNTNQNANQNQNGNQNQNQNQNPDKNKDPKPEKDPAKEAEEAKQQTAITNYFTISTELVTASMSCYITMINKHLKFLEKLMRIGS